MPQTRRGCAGPNDVFRTAVRQAKMVAGEGVPHLSAALRDKHAADLVLV
jgi:hypothetical protein